MIDDYVYCGIVNLNQDEKWAWVLRLVEFIRQQQSGPTPVAADAEQRETLGDDDARAAEPVR